MSLTLSSHCVPVAVALSISVVFIHSLITTVRESARKISLQIKLLKGKLRLPVAVFNA